MSFPPHRYYTPDVVEGLAPVALSEPAAPPAPPAVEAAKLADASEGATGGCALPSGWMQRGDAWWYGERTEVGKCDNGEWGWVASTGRGTAPTMLQAMCAALGIRYAQDAISGNYYATCASSPDLVRDERRIKSWKACCIAALEAFHARQQPVPKPSATPAAPTVERLLELAAEAVKVADDMRAAALDAEGWAARARAACGGEKR